MACRHGASKHLVKVLWQLRKAERFLGSLLYSLEWWLYSTVAKGALTSHIDGGKKIFGDGYEPKSGQSHAVARRKARSARKRRDRYLRRRTNLLKAPAQAGLMPNDPDDRKELEKLDLPLPLRMIHIVHS